MSLPDVQKMIDVRTEVSNLSEEQREALLRGLEEHRELKQIGARASKASAAQDIKQTLNRITDEVSMSL